jgi:hypothetical protein
VTTAALADPDRLLMPYPVRISPDVEGARTRHLAWIEGRGLWPDPKTKAAYRAADFPLLVAHVYPWAQGEDLDLVTDLIGWSFLWDDSLDKPGPRQADVAHTARLLDTYRDVLHGHPATSPTIPLVDAWRQLVQRLDERTSEHWRRRHAAHWEAAYRGFLEEARNNAAGRTPTFHEYLPLRRAAAGASICFGWAEAAGRYELPLHVHASDDLRTLDQDAADVVNMTNDLFSARMEWSAGDTDNIVPVLAQQESCSWPEAARRAEKIINTAMAHFQETEKHFLASPSTRTSPRQPWRTPTVSSTR